MKSFYAVLLIVGYSGFAQSNLDWEKLPEPQTTKAFVRYGKVYIDTLDEEQAPTVARESYFSSPFKFLRTVTPKQVTIEFRALDLNMDERIPVPRGMLFKDLSTSNIKYLDKSHGLPGNNLAIAQGSNGLIYLGSDQSLAIYNGQELAIYRGIEEFPLQNIRSLYYDSSDRLWISTDYGTGYIYDEKIYVPTTNVFGPTHLKGFNENKRTNELFVFTRYNGFFTLKNNKWLQYTDGLPTKAVSSVIRSSDDKLWVVYSHDGVSYIRNDSLFHYSRPGVYNTPRTAYEHRGEIYFGQFLGPLIKYRNDSLFYVDIDDQRDHRNYSMEGNSKGLWMGDYSQGVYLIKNDGEIQRFTSKEGLVSDASYAIMIDDFENVWVCDGFKGVSRIDEQLIYKSHKPYKPIVTDVISEDQSTWYFTGGGLYQETGGFSLQYHGAGNYCQNGVVPGKDSLWISSADHGLTLLNNEQFTFYNIREDLSKDSTLYSINLDNRGHIWGRDLADRLYRFHSGYFHNYSVNAPWKDINIKKLISTSSDVVFAITNMNGVIALKDGKYQHLSSANMLSSDIVYHVFEDNNGRFWYCLDTQIEIFNPRGKKLVLDEPVFKNNQVHDLLEVTPNNFLLITNDGVVWVEESPENGSFKTTLYGKEYGINLLDNTNIHRDHQGEILLTGGDHIFRFDPYFHNRTRDNPKLSLNRVLINDSAAVSHDGIKIAQQNNVEFIFNVINWGRSTNLYYKLERDGSVAPRWNMVADHSIPFNELTYGDYQFSVYAADSNSRSDTWNFSFTIIPYWYQTNWFKLLVVLALASVIMLYFIYRERRAARAKRVLEHLVDERTVQLKHEKSQVVRQLQEKELLRQEVHHRVKNNLTFLKGMLYLRANASSNQEVKMILDECQARIQTMALVHQNLYDVDNVSRVDLKTFIKELFVESHALFETDEKVNIAIQSDDLKLDMKLSIFIGLILNELITNSFKYAFKNVSEGKIYIHVEESNDHIKIEYADNGEGMDEGFQPEKSTGFGFKIINILVRQTDATITYTAHKYQLTIPK